jgi:uncharacterized membrane protein
MSATHQRFSVKGLREQEDAHRPSHPVNVGEVERWASAIGGTLLVANGLRHRSLGNLALALIGGGLIHRGLTGHCGAYEALHIDTSDKRRSTNSEHIQNGYLTVHTVTINRSAADLYAFWRDVENAPRFMINIESVEDLGDKKSHWIASAPFGQQIAWDSEVIADKPDHLIAWKTLPGSPVSMAGSVRFEPATGGRGTVVTLEQNLEPPLGPIGYALAKVFGEDPERQGRESLRHFKQLMETGEIPTIEGQSSGRSSNRQVATPLPHAV